MLNSLTQNVTVLTIILYTLSLLTIVGILLLGKVKTRYNFALRVFFALLMGALIGLLYSKSYMPNPTDSTKQVLVVTLINPIGNLYIGLLKTIITPLIMVSIIRSFTSLGQSNKLTRIGIKSIIGLLVTTAIAATVGVVFATITKVGSGFSLEGLTDRSKQTKTFLEVIASWFPNNIFADLATGDSRVIAIAVFSILIAIAVIKESKRHPERVKPFMDFLESVNAIIFRLTKMVINFTPYGVFAIIAVKFAARFNETFFALLFYIGVIYLAMLFHLIVVQMGLITFVARLNPFRFLSKIFPAQVVAFTTQSSYGTMPVTIKTLTNRVGVSERIASFVAPIGANMGMNACGGIYPAVVAIVTANAYGINLSVFDYLLIIGVSAFASIGIAGVPGTAGMAATVVLAYLGLPFEGLALVYAVDSIVDMGRTAVNVTGVSVISTIVAKSEGEFDKTIFNTHQTEIIEAGND